MQEERIDELRKDNFNLKYRVQQLEEFFNKLIKLIKNVFKRSDKKEQYAEVANDLYEHQIISDKTMEDIRLQQQLLDLRIKLEELCDGFDKAKCFTVKQLTEELGYNLDQCGYPHVEEEILDPMDLIQRYQEERASLNAEIDRVLADITAILGGAQE